MASKSIGAKFKTRVAYRGCAKAIPREALFLVKFQNKSVVYVQICYYL